MADDDKDKGGSRHPVMMLDTEQSSKGALEVNLGEPGTKGQKPTVGESGGASLEVDENGTGAEQEEEPAGEGPGGAEEAEGGAGGEAEGEAPAEGEGAAPEARDLGEFKAEDSDKAAEFDAEYLTENGGPNLTRFGAEWAANNGKLFDGTYDYLADRFGLSKAEVDAIGAGQMALQGQALGALQEAAGGKAAFDAAVAWGAKSYTATQRARFNKIMAGSDAEAQMEAIEALVARYQKANPRPRNVRDIRRSAVPRRDVTEGAGSGQAVQPYASIEEYRADFRKAHKANDPAAIAAARKKLNASPFWKNRGGK